MWPDGSQTHFCEDSIFNASCRIGGKLDALVGIKRIDGFDETDGADRNQIVLIAVVGIIFLGRVKQKEEFSRSKTTP